MSSASKPDVSSLPFTAVVAHGPSGLRFVSGQIAERDVLDRDVVVQTASIFEKLRALLGTHGRTLQDVLRVGVFLVDMNDYDAFNTAYREHFKAPYPARTCVAVRALPLGARVEMDVVVG